MTTEESNMLMFSFVGTTVVGSTPKLCAQHHDQRVTAEATTCMPGLQVAVQVCQTMQICEEDTNKFVRRQD